MSSNSNAFRASTETFFLVNILNSMYNDNLNQINNLIETINNLNNYNNQIRTYLVQLLHSNQSARRTDSRRIDTNLHNFFNNINSTTNTASRIPNHFISEHNSHVNRNRRNNSSRNRAFTMDDYARSLYENFFQPVEISPTQSQFEAATRRVRYCDISRPINTSCPISLEDFNDNDMVTVIRPCGHIFHNEQITNWFRTNCRCPVCRYDIREYNSNASNQFFNNQDSSGNNVERNNANNNENENENLLTNQTVDDEISNIGSTSLETLLLNNIFGSSGNYTDDQRTHVLSSFINLLSRTQHPR